MNINEEEVSSRNLKQKASGSSKTLLVKNNSLAVIQKMHGFKNHVSNINKYIKSNNKASKFLDVLSKKVCLLHKN